MRVQTKSVLAAVGLLLATLAPAARAQVNIPFGPANYEHDLQIFAPLELDLDNLPEEDTNCGYFFQYSKLAWSYSGERVTVGDPNVVAFAEEIYRDNPNDEGVRPAPHQIDNALQDVPPWAGFALGDRYEFGYRDRDNGWMIGILDGPELYQTEVYGFGEFNPTIDPDYTAADDTTFPGTFAGGDLRAFGFGSVPVNFDTPPGYLMGFRDYLVYLGESAIGTVAGPLLYVGNYGMQSATDTDPGDQTITYFRIADDLDGDAQPGVAFAVDVDGNIIAVIHDFDDLHQFNIFFDQVTVRNAIDTQGIEAMWSHVLTNQNYLAKHQNNHLELFYGARFLRLNDFFRVDALGSILGDSFWQTTIDNQIVGPQVALRWVNRRQRWTINTNAKFTFGYNVEDWRQVAAMGPELIPGALNRPLYGRPTYSTHGLRKSEFSPLAELRVEAAYHLSKAFALKVGYTGMYVGNIRRAAPSVRYYLPTMGFQDAGTQNVVVNGVDFGVEFVH